MKKLYGTYGEKIPAVACSVTFAYEGLKILESFKQTLLIDPQVHLTFCIKRFIGVHDSAPVFSRKGSQVIGLYSGDPGFVQIGDAVFDEVFYLFRRRSVQHRIVELNGVFLEEARLLIHVPFDFRIFFDLLELLQTAGVGYGHVTAYPHHYYGNVVCQSIKVRSRRINGPVKALFVPTSAEQPVKRPFAAPVKAGCKLIDLLRRPELGYADLAAFDPERPALPAVIREQVEIRVKYAGYIERQQKDVEQYRKLQSRPLPPDLDYSAIDSLRLEARQKLNAVKPLNFGQAARISGVSPADITALMIFMETRWKGERT